MKLVFVTQRVDPADPVLGATVAKLTALAARVEELVVLSLAPAALDGAGLPPNARVVCFGAGSKLGRGVRFERALARELRGADGVLAHMCPIYAVLAAPLARPLRIPVLLWYAHWHASPTLRLATRVVTRAVSVDAVSYPVPTPKLAAIGHGIDFSAFRCAEPGDGADLRAIALGRTSPSKGLEIVLEAVALVPGVRIDLYGASGSAEEWEHRARLQERIAELGLEERAAIHDPVPRERVAELHAAADVLVNNMRAGAPDKAVYEACASCLPVLASNPSFGELFAGLEPRLSFDRASPDALAERLRALAALTPAQRGAVGRALRERAVRRHSVESWADAVVRLLGERSASS